MAKRTHEEMDYPEMAFFMNESLSDVVFVIEGQRLPAIKNLLIVKSPVFRAMFSGNFCESKELEKSKLPEIPIKDTTVDAFKTLIRFIYTEVLLFKDNNDLQHICEVYRLSDRYDVIRLRRRVGQHLKSRINVKDLTSISRVVFEFNIEVLMAEVMAFIETNINEVIQRDVKELRELNDSTKDKLLDVLTGDGVRPDSELIYCIIGEKKIAIKKQVILSVNATDKIRNAIRNNKYQLMPFNDKTLDALKVLFGFLYFDKLIIKDEEDLQLIRELCVIAKLHFDYKPFDELIANHLKDRITVENLESISIIAFEFKIEELMKRVNDFTKENITEIVTKNDTILHQINDSTNGYLLDMFAEFIRKTSRK